MDVLNGSRNKFIALILGLLVSIYVVIPDSSANSNHYKNGVDCTGLIAVNYLNFA